MRTGREYQFCTHSVQHALRTVQNDEHDWYSGKVKKIERLAGVEGGEEF